MLMQNAEYTQYDPISEERKTEQEFFKMKKIHQMEIKEIDASL